MVKNQSAGAITAILIEVMFVLLPFGVYLLYFVITNTAINTIWQLPEWSFTTAIISGQSIAKIISAAVEDSTTNSKPILSSRVILTILVLLLSGVLPALFCLYPLIDNKQKPSDNLVTTQLVFFTATIISSIIINWDLSRGRKH